MKKHVITLAVCLALSATSAIAIQAKAVEQKPLIPAVSVVNTAAKGTILPVKQEGPKFMSKEEAKKFFEEKREKDRRQMYSDLKLTEEQIKKAEALDIKTKDGAREVIKKVHNEAKKLRELKSKKASVFVIYRQKFALYSAKQKADKYFDTSRKEFEAILTKEQKEKYKIIHEAKKKEMEKFKKQHKGGYKKPGFMLPPPVEKK